MRGRVLVPALAAAMIAGCAVPVPDLPGGTDPAPAQGGEGTGLATADPAGPALAAQLTALDAAVSDVAAELTAALDAASAGDVDVARTTGAAAVTLLLGGDGTPGLLPATAPDRAGGGADDLVSATVTLAGDAGGERGRVVLELLRDPLVGDLGAWQRDAPGVVAGLRTAVSAAGADPVALDAGLAAAAGELTRALGYALAVADAPDAALAVHAARSAVDRLEVVRVALDLGAAALAATVGGTADGTSP